MTGALRRYLGLAAAACAGAGMLLAAPKAARAEEAPAAFAKRMQWFEQARFGMFIHWGVYSVPAGEWNGHTNYAEWFLEETHMPVSQYERYAQQFDPEQFDAKAWVKVAKDAGMKYLVITSKHHDGFGMFPSKLTDWCIKSTPFKRDPLKELSEACRAAGIKFCTYYSIMDWHHPDWGKRRAWNDRATGTPDMDRYTQYMKGQLAEIITNYHPAILWFDGGWEDVWTSERGEDLYNYLRKLDPKLIINNRVGKPRNTEGGGFAETGRIGDYGTPEQTIPPTGFGPGVYWESCMTLNDHWGYNKHDENWKSPQTVIRNLIDIASKGGNYLLNVGPTAQGVIPQPSVDCLERVGAWMKVNGEAIYGTQASPFATTPWGRATRKGNRIYLHLFDWPAGGQLAVPAKGTVKRAFLLAQPGRKLTVTPGGDAVTIALPNAAPDPIATVVVLETSPG